MSVRKGDRIGPYEVLEPLGAGGMGEVYRARDTRLRRDVAIKVLPESWAADPERLARFEREAQLLATLNHPNVAMVYGLEPSGDTIAIVMELVEGRTLRDLLGGESATAGRRCLPPEEALRIAGQLADALGAVHARGIVHHDLKPANIKVTPAGVVKVLDFGLAITAAGEQSPDQSDLPTVMATTAGRALVAGTPAYMSPEQVRGARLDKRTDIWAFGCLLYEMLTGRTVFGSTGTAPEILARVLDREPEWTALPASTPASVRLLLRRCLEKDTERRLHDIADARLELTAHSTDLPPSIAVLPLTNLSADKENEYFSDGLTEEIINVLARIPGLKVTARTSAFAFRGKEQDIRQIAEKLDVRTVLEGSVRRAGNRVRVSAHLVNAADGYHLWSARYDRELADVFAIQDEIAQAIADALQVKLSTFRQYTPEVPAYEAYLKGQYYRAKITPESLALARGCYEQASVLDPGYALPHAALGALYVTWAFYGFIPTHTAMPLARASAEKALGLDPLLPEAHATLGEVASMYDYDVVEAERRFRLAMTHEPVTATVRVQYAWYLIDNEKARDGVRETRQALVEDPLNVFGRHTLFWGLIIDNQIASAVAEASGLVELADHLFLGYFDLGWAYLEQGQVADAVASVERACALAPWDVVPAGVLGGLYKLTGENARADEQLQKLGDGNAYHAPLGLFLLHLVSGEIDQAADWAGKAIEQRAPALIAFLRAPYSRTLRDSSRWPALAKAISIPAG